MSLIGAMLSTNTITINVRINNKNPNKNCIYVVMENTFKQIIVATSHFVVHKQQTAQMRLRLMLLKRHIMFSDRQ